MLRIALANHTPIDGSGSGTYTAMVARALARRGHAVCVLTPQADEFPLGGGIRTAELRLARNSFPSFTGHPLSRVTYDQLDAAALRALVEAWDAALRSLRAEWAPDVLHVQHLWVGARGAARCGLPMVATCHGSEADFAARHPRIARLLGPDPDAIAVIVNVSQFVAERLGPWLGPLGNAVTVPNPYDDHLFFFDGARTHLPSSPHLGFVGRLVVYKRVDHFFEIGLRVRRDFPSLRLTVAGDGPERSRLERLAASLGFGGAVRFVGQVPQQGLRELYRDIDLLIVPSHREPFGLVVPEALACGTPSVVAESGGLAELIFPPFVTGYTDGSVAEAAHQVIETLRSTRRSGFSEAAADYARTKYASRECMQRLEQLYLRAARDGDRSRRP
jgi:glycosyltransferase involved in cell wall biosynthesis